jgi:hypothetical protein
MPRPNDLQPGDILLYKNHGLLGTLIGWFSWDGGKGNTDYSHIGQVFDAVTSMEMNPPSSRLFDMKELDFDRIDVYRFDIKGVNPYADPTAVTLLQNYVKTRIGMKYDFGFIGECLGAGLLARAGAVTLAQKWIHNTTRDNHREVCSTWCEDNNTKILKAMYGADFDLFPAFTAQESTKPSDWPSCPYLKRIG